MKVVSTMGSGHLGCEIELEAVASTLSEDGLSYKVQSDSMLTARFEGEGPALSLYRTGTFQVRGAPDPDGLREAADRLVKYLGEKGVPISDPYFEHKTSVFLANIDQEVNLEQLAVAIGLEQVEYEPEQFPGLVFRPDGFPATLLVFSTGKIIIGGTTDEDEAREGVERVKSALPG